MVYTWWGGSNQFRSLSWKAGMFIHRRDRGVREHPSPGDRRPAPSWRSCATSPGRSRGCRSRDRRSRDRRNRSRVHLDRDRHIQDRQVRLHSPVRSRRLLRSPDRRGRRSPDHRRLPNGRRRCLDPWPPLPSPTRRWRRRSGQWRRKPVWPHWLIE